MLTAEENDLLTRTDRGTLCGELMRRYWQPAALSEEIPAGGAPLPIRLLGEDLVLFRNEQGRPGLLGLHCSHRGADLSYARLEDGGLRCIYHGWLYDIQGRCLEQPGEPAGSSFHERIRHLAYPCLERGGLILAYLGPGEPPLLPAFGPFTAPDANVRATKLFSDCNYLQGNEGNIDLIHNDFLHFARRDLEAMDPVQRQATIDRLGAPDVLWGRGPNPGQQRADAHLLDVGVRVCKTRVTGGDQNYIRVATFVLPNLTAIPGGSINWHVPIDDTHHWKYAISFRRDGPVGGDGARGDREVIAPGPEYRPLRNAANRYLQDRQLMQTISYSGIHTVNQIQDLCVTEGEGPIQDRTQENLAPSDMPVALARNVLLSAIARVQGSGDPPGVVRDPARNSFPQIVTTFGLIPSSVSWRDYCEELAAEGTGWRIGGHAE